MTNDRPSELRRFLERVTVPSEGHVTAICWLWDTDEYADSDNGYGKFYADDGKTYMAHRWAYEFFIGPIPKGALLDHKCRNRACCNPFHLEPVSLKVNTLRGEGPTAKNARKTHCKRGHLLKGKNVLRRKDRPGHRECKACKDERTKARRGRRGS